MTGTVGSEAMPADLCMLDSLIGYSLTRQRTRLSRCWSQSKRFDHVVVHAALLRRAVTVVLAGKNTREVGKRVKPRFRPFGPWATPARRSLDFRLNDLQANEVTIRELGSVFA